MPLPYLPAHICHFKYHNIYVRVQNLTCSYLFIPWTKCVWFLILLLLLSPFRPSKMQFKIWAVLFFFHYHYSFRLLQSSKYFFPHQGNTFPAGKTLLSCKTPQSVMIPSCISAFSCGRDSLQCPWLRLLLIEPARIPIIWQVRLSLELLLVLCTNRSLGSTNLIQLGTSAGQLFCWISQRSNF